tara:strand:- start:153 stop:578 length:426 start_codon:yes stop_codon:yes gene_type:complete
MGYIIEVSFDIRKNGNCSFKNEIFQCAENLNCTTYYMDYEFEGQNRQMKRSHCILYIIFEDEYVENLMKFIRYVKTKKHTYIECLYEDNGINNIIYASPVYQKQMHKKNVKIYKNKLKINEKINKTEYTDEKLRNIIMNKS